MWGRRREQARERRGQATRNVDQRGCGHREDVAGQEHGWLCIWAITGHVPVGLDRF